MLKSVISPSYNKHLGIFLALFKVHWDTPPPSIRDVPLPGEDIKCVTSELPINTERRLLFSCRHYVREFPVDAKDGLWLRLSWFNRSICPWDKLIYIFISSWGLFLYFVFCLISLIFSCRPRVWITQHRRAGYPRGAPRSRVCFSVARVSRFPTELSCLNYIRIISLEDYINGMILSGDTRLQS